MATHRPQWRRIKLHRNYDVSEVANTLGISKGTVRRWLKTDGLKTISGQKPALIHGTTLKAFGKARVKAKAKYATHEFHCFRCKAPRLAAGNMADYVASTPNSGNLKALCSVCETTMNKHVANSSLPLLKPVLDIAIHRAPEHLVECPKPR